MRKLTAGLFMSVDGAVEAPNEWQFDSFDAELGEELGAVIARTDAAMLGRVGYQEWSTFWPGATDPFADFINGVPKYVASRTLTPADMTWQNSTLIEGDVFDFVRQLKAGEGGDIALNAGISLVRQMLFAGLLDTLILITHPVVAGAGYRHLFEPGDPTTRLTLTRSRQTSAGNVILEYTRRAE